MIRAAGAEEVAEQPDLAHPGNFGERHRAVQGGAREVEARGGGLGDEKRGHGEVEFIGKIAGQEFAQDARTAFYEDTQYASFGQIDEDEIEESGSPASMSTALSPSRSRARPIAGVAQYTRRSAPGAKKRACGSRSPVAVRVTRAGCSGSRGRPGGRGAAGP